jgi:hypothetical protein
MFSLAFALALTAILDPQTQATPPAPSSERICRGGGERTLGSHVRTQRRCLTAEQWQREDEARAARPTPSLRIVEGQNDGRTTAAPH